MALEALRGVYVDGSFDVEEMEVADMNPLRAHAPRSGFSTILRLNGFSDVLVDFMMGHAMPYGGAYFIPPHKLRQMYLEIEPQLSINQATRSVSELEKKMDDRLQSYLEVIERQQELDKLGDEMRRTERLLKLAEEPGVRDKVERMQGLLELTGVLAIT